jgi:hypothetical protein
MLVGRRRSLMRAVLAASPLTLRLCLLLRDGNAAEHAAPTWWKNQEDAGGQHNHRSNSPTHDIWSLVRPNWPVKGNAAPAAWLWSEFC